MAAQSHSVNVATMGMAVSVAMFISHGQYYSIFIFDYDLYVQMGGGGTKGSMSRMQLIALFQAFRACLCKQRGATWIVLSSIL